MRTSREGRSPRQRQNVARADRKYAYKCKWYPLTKSELRFFHTLLGVVHNFYYVVPQVHLSNLLDHKTWGQNWRGALSRIQRKSVDYVICSRRELTPVCAVELDNPSHNKPDRVERDKLVEALFKEAGIPLIRIKTQEQDDVGLLRIKLGEVIVPDGVKSSPSAS